MGTQHNIPECNMTSQDTTQHPRMQHDIPGHDMTSQNAT